MPGAKHESALACTLFGLYKPLVDGIDQRIGRAEIGVQHIVPPSRRFTGLQIAVNVRTAKAVNGLFGVTNQQQSALRAVVGRAVNLVKQAVLQRRCVLKLVNQCHRVLGQNAGTQRRAVVSCKSHIQPLQHVSKTKSARLALDPQQALLHMGRSMQAQLAGKAGHGGQLHQQLGQLLRFDGQIDRCIALACLVQPCGNQALGTGFQGGFQIQIWRSSPLAQGLQPALVKSGPQLGAVPRAFVVGQLAIQPVFELLGFLHPACTELLKLVFLLLQRLTD